MLPKANNILGESFPTHSCGEVTWWNPGESGSFQSLDCFEKLFSGNYSVCENYEISQISFWCFRCCCVPCPDSSTCAFWLYLVPTYCSPVLLLPGLLCTLCQVVWQFVFPVTTACLPLLLSPCPFLDLFAFTVRLCTQCHAFQSALVSRHYNTQIVFRNLFNPHWKWPFVTNDISLLAK